MHTHIKYVVWIEQLHVTVSLSVSVSVSVFICISGSISKYRSTQMPMMMTITITMATTFPMTKWPLLRNVSFNKVWNLSKLHFHHDILTFRECPFNRSFSILFAVTISFTLLMHSFSLFLSLLLLVFCFFFLFFSFSKNPHRILGFEAIRHAHCNILQGGKNSKRHKQMNMSCWTLSNCGTISCISHICKFMHDTMATLSTVHLNTIRGYIHQITIFNVCTTLYINVYICICINVILLCTSCGFHCLS